MAYNGGGAFNGSTAGGSGGASGGGGGFDMMGAMGAFGQLGAGIGSLFADYTNPSDPANKYLQNIPGVMDKYYSPYINSGLNANNVLQNQYNQLLNNPSGIYNSIGQNFQSSPGYNFNVNQAQNSANNAASAGGMLGTPQHQYQSAGMVSNLANQDYNNYMNQNLGLYGQGLQGYQGLSQQGYNASNQAADSLANMYGSMASNAYAGQNSDNEHSGGSWGSIMSGAASLIPLLFL